MDDVDLGVVAVELFQLGLDLWCVANEEKFFDVRVLAQRHHRTGHKVGRTEIAAHSIQGDLHRTEILRILARICKMKIRRASKPCLRRLAPDVLYNNRKMGKRYDRAPCCRTAGTL